VRAGLVSLRCHLSAAEPEAAARPPAVVRDWIAIGNPAYRS
jgi:hypothetical protein